MLAIYSACASARLRERCIVPIDVPCMLHLYVHVWVRHNVCSNVMSVRELASCKHKQYHLGYLSYINTDIIALGSNVSYFQKQNVTIN